MVKALIYRYRLSHENYKKIIDKTIADDFSRSFVYILFKSARRTQI